MTRRDPSAAEQRAVKTLRHYLRMVVVRTGGKWDSDCEAEVEGIVEDIVDAAASKAVEAIMEAVTMPLNEEKR